MAINREPEFFASLSLRTLSQVGVAVVISITGLTHVVAFAFAFHLDSGTAAGLASRQCAVIHDQDGVRRALQLGLADDVLRQQQANIAAELYPSPTHPWIYILTLLFVPFAAPWLMGINLKEEAAKLEAALSGARPARPETWVTRSSRRGPTGSALLPDRRLEPSKIVSANVSSSNASIATAATSTLQGRRSSGDEIVLAGPATALVKAGRFDRTRKSKAPRCCVKCGRCARRSRQQ